MMFFSVFVLVQMHAALTAEWHDEELYKIVKDYHTKFVTINDLPKSGRLIDLYTKNLEVILGHMQRYRHKQFPDMTTGNSEYKVRGLSELETEVYLLVPRCLDVNTIVTNTVLWTLKLYEYVVDHCYTWLIDVEMKCRKIDDIEDSSNYMCNRFTVTQLFEQKHGNWKPEEGSHTSGDNERDDIQYVMDVFKRVNDMTMLSEARKMNAPLLHRVVFNEWYGNAIRVHDAHSYGENYKRLEEKLSNVNREYVNKFDPGRTWSFDVEKLDGSPSVVAVLLQHALVNIGPTFNRLHSVVQSQSKDTSDKMSGERGPTSDRLPGKLGKICELTAHALLYAAIHDVDKHDDGAHNAGLRVPFGLYVAYCGGWTNFFRTHCPGDEDDASDQSCVEASYRDKITLNYRAITRKSLTDGHASDVHTDVHLEYLANVGNAVKSSPFEIAWTRYGWLSGEDLIVGRLGADTPEDLVRRTTLEGGNLISLTAAYYLLLPWNSNMETVFQFHNIVSYNVDLAVNGYVYWNAVGTALYLDKSKNDVDTNTLETLGMTLREYVTRSLTVYRYLQLSGLYSRSNTLNGVLPNDIDFLTVEKFKLLEMTNTIITKIEEIFTVEHEEFSNFNIPDNVKIDDTKELLYNNCRNATTYIKDFFSILKNSLDITDSLTFSCWQYLVKL